MPFVAKTLDECFFVSDQLVKMPTENKTLRITEGKSIWKQSEAKKLRETDDQEDLKVLWIECKESTLFRF